jgi:hypothetical protein
VSGGFRVVRSISSKALSSLTDWSIYSVTDPPKFCSNSSSNRFNTSRKVYSVGANGSGKFEYVSSRSWSGKNASSENSVFTPVP